MYYTYVTIHYTYVTIHNCNLNDTGLSTNGNCYKDLYRILCQNMGFNRNKITYKK